jgi:hypothetical protein
MEAARTSEVLIKLEFSAPGESIFQHFKGLKREQFLNMALPNSLETNMIDLK